MVSSKHETKKQEILESAFRIWGRDRFQTRSLSDLASAHDLTKQALYRYFSSKQKIELAMENRATEVYAEHIDEMFDKLSSLEGEEFVDYYVEDSIGFIRKQAAYIGYLSHRYRQADGPAIHRESMPRLNEMALKNADVPEVGIRYLNAIVFMEVHRGKDQDPNRWKPVWKEGFGSDRISREPDFARVLNEASRVDLSRFGDDPLMNAVFEAVMEEAGDEVSLGKVARKAGLTKSSLYNYWPSKDEMLNDVLSRQVSIYSDLFDKFAANFTDPEDRLFSYLGFTGTFFRRTPEILNYIQRVISLGVDFGGNRGGADSQFTKALNEVIDDGYINLRDYRPEELLGLTNLAGVIEIKHHLAEASVRIRIEQGLKDLYRLIAGGIQALRRTM